MNAFFRLFGWLLLIGGLAVLGFIYFPLFGAEISYQQGRFTAKTGITPIEPVSAELGLVIPKIEINTKVFPEVDAGQPEEYLPILVQGVAHSKGSALPGQAGTVFIFAHSSDTPLNAAKYNAVFYLLGKLESGDEVFLYYQSHKYIYTVSEKTIMAPAKVEEYVGTLPSETLVLQTCYPPGTTLRRLLVTAQLTGKDAD